MYLKQNIISGLSLVFVLLFAGCYRKIPKELEPFSALPEDQILITVEKYKNDLPEINDAYIKKYKSTLYSDIFSRYNLFMSSDETLSRTYKIILDQYKNRKGNDSFSGCESSALMAFIRTDDMEEIKKLPKLKDPECETLKNKFINLPKEEVLKWLLEKISEDKLPENWGLASKYCEIVESVAINLKRYDIAKKAKIWDYNKKPEGIRIYPVSEIAYYVDKLDKYDEQDKKIIVDYYLNNIKGKNDIGKGFEKRINMIMHVIDRFDMLEGGGDAPQK